ncbi:RodZ domain-containing protein [Synechococcus sp. PCC 7336]|uniref:helix-turn-helix domain-containing protein n=1 Tax=Synechococcus sp. PCC 7336 TaxID=195250 RepID=UPI00034AA7E1|nr:RodZ domain-containing protein [Synechococcus sp. PCC 7336]
MARTDSLPPHTLVDIGTQLREARESRGLSLEAIAHSVHIRCVYLEGIESANFDLLPEPIYVRGFLKTYGNYLDLDGSALAEQFTQTVPQLSDRKVVKEQPQTRSLQGIQLRPFHAWLAYVFLVVAAVGGISVFWERTGTGERPQTLPPTANRAGGSVNPTPDIELGPAGTGELPPFQTLSDWTYIAGVFPERDNSAVTVNPSDSGLQDDLLHLGIRVVDRASWLQVVADRKTVFEGILQPGAELEWEADESIVLRAGNAGGVLVTFNDEQLGVMGEFGEVRQQEFKRGVPVERETVQ